MQYDEGTKGTTSLRSLTHLPDGFKQTKKPQTKEQIEAIKAKAQKAAKAEPAPAKTRGTRAAKAEPVKTSTRATKVKVEPAKTSKPKKAAEPKTAKEKQAALDDWETNFKKQQAEQDAHAAIMTTGNVVEYKGKQYHVADSRRMTKSGAGKTELTLKDAGGKLYKLRVPTYSHPLKLVRKASDTEQADAKQSVRDMNQRKQERADAQYEKGKELGIDHNSVGDYALVKFTNGPKWVKIQKVDGTGRVGIQGSGSKLRFIDPQHIQSVSPTTSSDPAVQKAAKSAKDVAKSIEREAGLYSPFAQFHDRGDSGDGKIVKRTSISMPYVQRVRDLLEKKGFKFDGKKIYTNAETGVTVEMYNVGDSFSISIQHTK